MWRLLAIAACLLALTGCPMQITTIEQLQLIGNDPAYPLDGDYELANDIDASDTETWNAGAGFAPIGSDVTPFTGAFDGNGFSINGLYVFKTSPDNSDGGLFAYNDGHIHDLMITDASVLGGDPHITGSQGGLHMACLCAVNRGTIERCGIETSIVRGYIAGLLVGQATPESVIQNCYAIGRVYGTSPVRIGGLVGENGGLVKYCYAAARIWPGSFFDPEDPVALAGGLLGANGTIEYGEYINYGIVSDSYYDYEVAEVTDTGKGDPKTTVEMQTLTTFVDWDFTTIWDLQADYYPSLLFTEGEGEGETVAETFGSIASSYYDEYVTLYRTHHLNDENEPVYTAHNLKCRLDRKTRRITDGSGLQVTCSHVMLCDTEIDPVTDYIVTAALDKLIPKEVLEHKDFAASHYEVWLV